MVDVCTEEVGGPFRVGGLAEEGLIAPVLMSLEYKFTDVGQY